MKRKISKLLLILLIALAVAALAACDNTGNDPAGDNPGKDDYESAEYTVSFDTNGGSPVDSITGVKYGEKIAAPGVTPVKTGYRFLYWTTNSSSAYDFNTPVTKNLTLTAYYEPKEYTHAVNIYGVDDKGVPLTKAYFTGASKMSLTDSDGNAITEFKTKYAALAEDLTFPVPKIVYPENFTGKKDYFVYWYYLETDKEGVPIKDGDGNVKRVQFTTWADENNTTGVTAMDDYKINKDLHLYAMWYSQLPDLNVNFWMSESDKSDRENGDMSKNPYFAYGELDTQNRPDFKTNGTVSTKVTELIDGIKTAKPGYDFIRWYYNLTTGEGDNAVTKSYEFSFDDPDDVKDKPTVLYDDIDVYAEWRLNITINSAMDYNKLYSKIKSPDTSEAELKELQSANIYFGRNVDFAGLGTLEPLFDDSLPFKGVITSEGENKFVLSNMTISHNEYVSLFGVLDGGSVKNLIITDAKLILDNTGEIVQTAYIAPFVSKMNGGKLENLTSVSPRFLSVNPAADVIAKGVCYSKNEILAGGIAAFVRNGTCDKCVAEFNDGAYTAEFYAERLTIGGLTGRAENADINECTVKKFKVNATVKDDFSGLNGKPELNVGGIVGFSYNGNLSKCLSRNITVRVESSDATVNIGGLAGTIDGTSVNTSQSEAADLLATADTVNMGGLTGYNFGYIKNSIASDSVLTAGGKVRVNVGGLAGYCNNIGGNTGSLTLCYATGGVNATASTEVAYINAGGLVGYAYGSSSSGCFSLVSVEAFKNQGATEKVSIGHLAGKVAGTLGTGMTNWYYKKGIPLIFNGVEYVAPAEGETSGFAANVTVLEKEKAAEESEFKQVEFLKSMGFSVGESSVWEIVEGELPVLK